jgi:carbonic anhydrase
VLLLAPLTTAGCARPTAAEDGLTPLERLKCGNERFASGEAQHPHLDAALRRDVTEHGQHPFATIVACSDSRVPVELLFDQGIGDIFVIRVAGNVLGRDETGSIEYAVEHLDMPLVVILGHRQCGAVAAAIEHGKDTPCIEHLLDYIEPVAERVKQRSPELEGPDLVSAVVEENVWEGVADLITLSALTRDRISRGGLEIIGAVYDIESGRVRWLGRHPRESELLKSAAASGSD